MIGSPARFSSLWNKIPADYTSRKTYVFKAIRITERPFCIVCRKRTNVHQAIREKNKRSSGYIYNRTFILHTIPSEKQVFCILSARPGMLPEAIPAARQRFQDSRKARPGSPAARKTGPARISSGNCQKIHAFQSFWNSR